MQDDRKDPTTPTTPAVYPVPSPSHQRRLLDSPWLYVLLAIGLIVLAALIGWR